MTLIKLRKQNRKEAWVLRKKKKKTHLDKPNFKHLLYILVPMRHFLAKYFLCEVLPVTGIFISKSTFHLMATVQMQLATTKINEKCIHAQNTEGTLVGVNL